MGIKEAVLWALLGGGAAEMTLFLGTLRPPSAKKPWVWPWTRAELRVYAVWVVVRLGLSGALAAPFADAGRITDSFMAFMLGVAAPLLMTKVAALAQVLVGRSAVDLAPQEPGTTAESGASQSESRSVPEPRTQGESPASDIANTGVDNAER
ncbi:MULTISPECIES: hypothetical protein [Streptomyces]|uniref:hypothetical protein n=1 Tax=Streptomyces TaxID=1883 RepID=UPI00131D4AD0|nr:MULTISPECIES: hypothetical protein [Streptomyces]